MKRDHSKIENSRKRAPITRKLIDALWRQVEDGFLISDEVSGDKTDGFEDKNLEGLPSLKPESVSPGNLALLAALIDPANCGSEDPTPALESALYLLLRSAAVTDGLKAAGSIEKYAPQTKHLGLGRFILAHVRDVPLLLGDDEIDRAEADKKHPPNGVEYVQNFLQRKLNFEGKSSASRSWKRVRAVRENVARFVVWNVNAANIRRAKSAFRADVKTRARKFGRWNWKDANEAVDEHWDGWEHPDLEGWLIPRAFLRRFVRWYREIRRMGVGFKTIMPLTRAEVEGIVSTQLASVGTQVSKSDRGRKAGEP
jgi:hypothetical protein